LQNYVIFKIGWFPSIHSVTFSSRWDEPLISSINLFWLHIIRAIH